MDFNIGWPEGIWIAISLFSLSIAAAKDGEPRDNYNFAVIAVGHLMGFLLLIWGGFFQ